jgi:Protein tyrosine phosphatase-like protein, PTPLA
MPNDIAGMDLATSCVFGCCVSSLHAVQALGMDMYVLLWLRYSAFLVLYPVGVGSELTMAALALSQVPACHGNRVTPTLRCG